MPNTTTFALDERPWPATSRAVYRGALIVAAAAAIAVTAMVGLTSSGWIGKSFPGFFVLPNRVIPSIGLGHWSGTSDGVVYQRTVVAVAGVHVDGNGDAYRRAAAPPAGAAVAYTLRHGATTETLALASRIFSVTDYWLIFGSYMLTGLLYLLLGIVGAWLLPDARLGRALLLLGGSGGIYALSGAGIYDGGADLRIHALAEAFFPAALAYLALVFAGCDRQWTTSLGASAWWLSLVLAVPYQLVLGQPGAYSVLHGACETYLGLAGFAVGGVLVFERTRAADDAGPLLRSALAGALLGLGVPGTIMVLSGLSGGALPVNVVTASAFSFPLCLAYGLFRESRLAAVAH